MKQLQNKISKEAIKTMPVASYEGTIKVIDTPELLAEAMEELDGHSILGIDSETRPSFKKGEMHKVSLLQIATSSCCYLFRLNKIGLAIELVDLLESKEVIKVGLSLTDDFLMLRRRRKSFKANGYIDLQQMIKDYGIEDLSLQKVYANLFGKRLSKGQRLSNWEQEVLSPAQQQYAALDAVACLEIYNALVKEYQPGNYKLIVVE
ncbi:MAG TPA: 3'-5' exonuclease [Bacteroidaceae bacterium]|nr:3'-5' exonuclease [Bacteroidaceae bacterium]